jgi:murein DD-endopeptidase MepM/ murein hydrolase activator NlpD
LLRVALSGIAEFVRAVRSSGAAFRGLFSSADGRWTLVSTCVTASVAFTVTALALAATPPATPGYEARRTEAAFPYDLLTRLTGRPALPGIATEDYRQAGFISSTGSEGPLTHVLREAAELMGPIDAAAAEAERGDVRTLTVRAGDTIMGMLQEAGVPQEDAVAVIDAMRPVFSPRNIRPGQIFEASFGQLEAAAVIDVTAPASSAPPEPARLLALSFSPSVERQITVSLTTPDEYSVEEIQKKLDSRYQRAGATIDSSLYLAAIQAGIPASIVVEMIHMFSYDVDFQRDVHQGDQFEVFFNHFFTPDGEPAKTGNILAATMTLGGKSTTLYRFETPNGPEYFDATGSSAKSMLMMTPVDGARISSGFGRRRHPVLGYTRMHQGIDFAVPSGTPIMAAGDGTVATAGRSGGYGNLLVIRHNSGYSTAYGHLSRFARGLKAGARVRQGEVVAYSGNTGLSTGPHLHYEIRLSGKPVNPRTVKVAAGRKLDGEELAAFVEERGRIEKLVASMPLQSRVAAAEELRETAER